MSLKKSQQLIQEIQTLLNESSSHTYQLAGETQLTKPQLLEIKAYANAYLSTAGQSFNGYLRPYGPVMRVLMAYQSVPKHREHDYNY